MTDNPSGSTAKNDTPQNVVRHDTSIEADRLAGAGSTTHRLLAQWKTPANITTMVRIVLVIVAIVLACLAGPWGHDNYGLRWTATVLFVIAASTDKLDGYLARSRNEVTDLGKILDPIADKLLTCSMLVVLSVFSEIPWWVTILFLIREIGITIWRMVSLDKHSLVIPANWPGKLKTVFECVATALLLAPLWQFDGAVMFHDGWWGAIFFEPGSWSYWYELFAYVILGVALGLCLYSGGNYLYQAHVQLAVRRKAAAQQTAEATDGTDDADETDSADAKDSVKSAKDEDADQPDEAGTVPPAGTGSDQPGDAEAGHKDDGARDE